MYSVAIKRELLWVPENEIRSLKEVKKAFTFRPRFDNLEDVPAFGVKKGYFGFPRHASIRVNKVTDDTALGKMASVRFVGSLRGPQVSVIEKFEECMMEGDYDLILSADTGAGKTVMLLNMWAKLGRAALVVVPKTDLINQWRERILEFTDLPSDRIGIARQGVCE